MPGIAGDADPRPRPHPRQAPEAQALIHSLRRLSVFTLNALPPQLSPALVEKLVRAEPATIGHFRHWGFMDPAQGDAAGRAHRGTRGDRSSARRRRHDHRLRAGPASPRRRAGRRPLRRHPACRIRRRRRYAAKVAKVAGVIIDGVVADIGEIRQYGVPVWCRGLSAITTKRIGMGGSFCAPISCGGVAVQSGRRDHRRRMRRGRDGPGRRRGRGRPRDRDAGSGSRPRRGSTPARSCRTSPARRRCWKRRSRNSTASAASSSTARVMSLVASGIIFSFKLVVGAMDRGLVAVDLRADAQDAPTARARRTTRSPRCPCSAPASR